MNKFLFWVVFWFGLALSKAGLCQITVTDKQGYTCRISWSEVPGATHYEVIQSGRSITTINSTDTWLWLTASAHSVTVQPKDTIGTQYGPITTTVYRAAALPISRIAGDYRALQVDSVKGLRLYGKFTAADKNKCISIKGACRKSWYRNAPLTWNGWVGKAGLGWVELKDSLLPNGKHLGDALATYMQPATFTGFIATNKMSAMRNLLRNRTRIVASGICYLDPFRDSTHSYRIASQLSPAVFQLSRSVVVEGNFIFGEQEQVGPQPSRIGWYSGDNVDGHTSWYRQHVFEVFGGSLTIQGSWTMLAEQRNQTSYLQSVLYTRNPQTDKPCNLFFSGTFNGRQLADNRGGYCKSGKEVIACFNSYITASEAFGLRGYYGDSVSVDYNKRLLLRSCTIDGTGYRKMGQEAMCMVERGRIYVDSAAYPYFSFFEIEPKAVAILKTPGTPVGGLNQFEFSQKVPYSTLSAYVAEFHDAENVAPGAYLLVIDAPEQVGQPNRGHAAYLGASVEVEWSYINFVNQNGFLLRQSDCLNCKGKFNQYSLIGINTSYSRDRFRFIEKFGGISQYEYFQSAPFVQQESTNLRNVLSDGGVNWHVRLRPVVSLQ